MNVLMVGTGEYTTGFVHESASSSDKGAGVVALTVLDLRRRGIVDRVLMAGTNGTRFPGIRKHLAARIQDRYADISVEFESFPDDGTTADPQAWRSAVGQLSAGDVVIVFTPDDTHFEIALGAVQRGCHVLVAKPLVRTLHEHRRLAQAARDNGVLVAMEVHKRWDPIYADARDRIRELGDFSFFSSYMSQPRSQLDTFRAWAGKSSDISYYLNAHHIDFNAWAVGRSARPKTVTAHAATGVARGMGLETEDTITLTVQWENVPSGNLATAIYTASWIAPRSDVHSQQQFFYMGHGGEVRVDQAHRGYSIATDAAGYVSPNPLFMKYPPNDRGEFAGQAGYGYRSIADFVLAAASIRGGQSSPGDAAGQLATIDETMIVTAILEAGRISLDNHGHRVAIRDDADGCPQLNVLAN